MTNYHDPVLLGECLEGLNLHSGGVYVDVTFGGGGHSRAIVSILSEGHLYAFDQDDDDSPLLPTWTSTSLDKDRWLEMVPRTTAL